MLLLCVKIYGSSSLALELHPFHDGMTRGENVTAERAAAKLINSVPPQMRKRQFFKKSDNMDWNSI
jgi:hypothetical protein